MRQSATTSIVFDIGWVFVRLNYRPFLEFLGARGAHAPDMDTVIAGIALSEHECGREHGGELLGRLAALTTQAVAPAELHAQWVGMFERGTQIHPRRTMIHQKVEHGLGLDVDEHPADVEDDVADQTGITVP